MKKVFWIAVATALSLCAGWCSAQTTQVAGYVHVANQGDTILSAPASWTGQAGGGAATDSTWSPTFAVTSTALPLAVQWNRPTVGTVWTSPVLGNDPYPGYSKEVGAIQTGTAQTFTVQPAGGGGVVTVVVPALPVTTPIAPPVTIQAVQFTCAATVAGTQIPAGLPTNGLAMICVFGLNNLPVQTATPARHRWRRERFRNGRQA
jgi:hypothetical protein